MSEKFDPAPYDKYAGGAAKALQEVRKQERLDNELASAPTSETQPTPKE